MRRAIRQEDQVADAALGGCQQALAKRGGMDAVGDLQPLAAVLVLAGRHRLGVHEQVVQPARAGKARLVGDGQQVAGLRQQGFDVLLGQVLQEALGADAHPAREQALEVVLAQRHALGHLAQGGLALVVRLQVADGLLDALVIFCHLAGIDHGPVHRVITPPFYRVLRKLDNLTVDRLHFSRAEEEKRHPIFSRRWRRGRFSESAIQRFSENSVTGDVPGVRSTGDGKIQRVSEKRRRGVIRLMEIALEKRLQTNIFPVEEALEEAGCASFHHEHARTTDRRSGINHAMQFFKDKYRSYVLIMHPMGVKNKAIRGVIL